MRKRGLRGTRLVWGIKINFYPRELLLHISQRLDPSADRCGRQKSVYQVAVLPYKESAAETT